VTVRLANRFMIKLPGADISLPIWQRAVEHPIVAAYELFSTCAGARTLRTLSRMTGLLALDLTIWTDFVPNQAFYDAYKSAGIVLRAGEVKLTVNPGLRGLGPQSWHAKLGKALGL
jgi:hypothetical protein